MSPLALLPGSSSVLGPSFVVSLFVFYVYMFFPDPFSVMTVSDQGDSDLLNFAEGNAA
jgi:hypothetical protein